VIGNASLLRSPSGQWRLAQLQHAAVGFCDLSAQDQTDAAAACLVVKTERKDCRF